jgi:hypothetical protein
VSSTKKASVIACGMASSSDFWSPGVRASFAPEPSTPPVHPFYCYALIE